MIYINSFIVQQFTILSGVLAGTAMFSLCTGYVYEEPPLQNIMYMEPWLTKSPLMENKLRERGVRDYGEMMYNDKNTYLVIYSEVDYDWLEGYFQERFGECDIVKDDVIEISDGITMDVVGVKRVAK